MEDMLASLKKEDARIKGEFALKHSNSKDKVLRSMAEGFKKSLDNDTSIMLETGSGMGRRISPTGKAYGTQMKKADSGRYEEEVVEKAKDLIPPENLPQKKAKGGVVKMAKGGLVTRADGAAKRGKTKGRTI